MVSGFSRPMAGARGSNTIAPSFDIRSPLVANLSGHTYVTGGDGKHARQEWRTWSDNADTGRDISAELIDTSDRDGRLETFAEFRSKITDMLPDLYDEAEALSDDLGLKTRLGPFFATQTIFSNASFAKKCIAFGGYVRAGRSYFAGFICAPTGSAVEPKEAACFLDGLVLAGDPAPPPSANCSAASPTASQ